MKFDLPCWPIWGCCRSFLRNKCCSEFLCDAAKRRRCSRRSRASPHPMNGRPSASQSKFCVEKFWNITPRKNIFQAQLRIWISIFDITYAFVVECSKFVKCKPKTVFYIVGVQRPIWMSLSFTILQSSIDCWLHFYWLHLVYCGAGIQTHNHWSWLYFHH